jgi:hypothetical protein
MLFNGRFGSLTWDRHMNSLRWPKIPKHHPQYEWIRLIIHMIMPDPRKRIELNDALIERIRALPEPDFALFTRAAAENEENANNINVGAWMMGHENGLVGGCTRRRRRSQRRRKSRRRY